MPATNGCPIGNVPAPDRDPRSRSAGMLIVKTGCSVPARWVQMVAGRRLPQHSGGWLTVDWQLAGQSDDSDT